MEALDFNILSRLASDAESTPRGKSVLRRVEEFVTPILEARNPDHLAAVVDQQIESSSFEKMIGALTASKRQQTKEQVDYRAIYLAVLGPDCARLIEHICRNQTAITSATEKAAKVAQPALNDVVRVLPR